MSMDLEAKLDLFVIRPMHGVLQGPSFTNASYRKPRKSDEQDLEPDLCVWFLIIQHRWLLVFARLSGCNPS